MRHLLFGLIGLLAGNPCVHAGEIYSYTDEQGIHFSNVPYDVRFKRVAGLAPAGDTAPFVPGKTPANTYSALIKSTAASYQLEEALLHAVIKTESGYNPNAVSPKGAIGLMQLMPATARRYGVVNARDPADNLQGGARYLKDLLARFDNNLPLVLAAYNAGEMAVARHKNAVPPYAETQNYVPQVMRHYQIFSGCSSFPCKSD